MAVAQLEDARESWERIKKKLLEEANRAVRAFRVNRDSGANMVGPVHYAGTTDQPENGGGAGSDTAPLWRK